LDPTIIEVLKYLIVHGMPFKPALLHIIITSSSSISYLIPNAAKNTSSSLFISIVAKTISCTFFILRFIFTSLAIPLVIGIIYTPFLKTMATKTRIYKKDCKFSSKLCDRDKFLVLEKV
jgi:hypothetical protein